MDETNILVGLVIMAILFAITGIVLGAIAYNKAVGATIPSTIFIFRPGLEGKGVYTDWERLYNDLPQVPGPKQIYFDSTNNDGPIVIPNGLWDMTNVEWIAPISYEETRIHITTTAMFRNLGNLTGSLWLTYTDTTRPCMVFPSETNQAPITMNLQSGAAVSCSGNQPFVQVTGGVWTVFMGTMTAFIAGPCVQCSTNTANSGVFIFVDDNSSLQPNTLLGSGTFQVAKQSLTASVSPIQNITGTFIMYDAVSTNNMEYTPTVMANWSGTAPASVTEALDRIAAVIGPIP